jgi:phenylacetate-coenzyme A ligase PaaK-like adenylate-forming protein
MFEKIRQELRQQAVEHMTSRAQVEQVQQTNFFRQLSRLNQQQYKFWFHDHPVTQLADLSTTPMHTNAELIQTQIDHPPYGIFSPGELLFMSSGSSGGPRVRYYHSWNTWMEINLGAARNLLAHGVNSNDTIMTTDVGNMQLGYRHNEDAASFICGARIVKSGRTTWHQKIDLIQEYGVTVLIASTSKLRKLASLISSRQMVSSLRLIIQIGEPLTVADQEYIQQQFGVDQIVDGYGCAELGLISWTCLHGHQHVNEDLLHIEVRNGKNSLTRLVGEPIFNLSSNETLKYSYKGQCACGSFLSTVDEFIHRSDAINPKE